MKSFASAVVTLGMSIFLQAKEAEAAHLSGRYGDLALISVNGDEAYGYKVGDPLTFMSIDGERLTFRLEGIQGTVFLVSGPIEALSAEMLYGVRAKR